MTKSLGWAAITAASTLLQTCPPLVDVAYACLTHAGIKTCRAQGQTENKKVLRLEPVSKLKDRMRQIVWQENVQDAIKHSHEKPVIRRLEKLLAA